jgi:phage terminase small subunit
MPALPNLRHEHFAVLVGGGTPTTQAYLAAGFSGKGAAQSASRLVRVAAVANRIAELHTKQH